MLCDKHENNPDQIGSMSCNDCLCDECNKPLHSCDCDSGENYHIKPAGFCDLAGHLFKKGKCDNCGTIKKGNKSNIDKGFHKDFKPKTFDEVMDTTKLISSEVVGKECSFKDCKEKVTQVMSCDSFIKGLKVEKLYPVCKKHSRLK